MESQIRENEDLKQTLKERDEGHREALHYIRKKHLEQIMKCQAQKDEIQAQKDEMLEKLRTFRGQYAALNQSMIWEIIREEQVAEDRSRSPRGRGTHRG